ncbi:pseudouridine synthase [Arcanobacterium haemolyticum]|uniref:pseudouridine synthase n=1 Tax=Arcanobacterium haemolyticum TaxID=28264 RepID=UPI0011104D4E|nr:pseudouridine synthase [Arcanobacterium haemolyticum]QCX47295.1 pseudouridine synthase [Arcanobacterium haemolyticum]
MEATGHLITSHLQIPADAVAHGDIQAAAEIPFSVLEELAEEVGAEKIPVHTLSRVGWHYTKADQIIALARQRGLSDWRYGGFGTGQVVSDFRHTYC